MPDPDDVLDERKGEWKSQIYGLPFEWLSPVTPSLF